MLADSKLTDADCIKLGKRLKKEIAKKYQGPVGMNFVIDTNVLFSFFKSDSATRRIIINTPLRLYAPKETFAELVKYNDEICNKSHITKK